MDWKMLLGYTLFDRNDGYIRHDFNHIGLGFGRSYDTTIVPWRSDYYWINVYKKAQRVGLGFLKIGFGVVKEYHVKGWFEVKYTGAIVKPFEHLYLRFGRLYYSQDTPYLLKRYKYRQLHNYLEGWGANCPDEDFGAGTMTNPDQEK